MSEKIKDAADLFAAEGEEAREILEELKKRAKDALDVTISEAPEGSARERYRYAKARILPLLVRLEDEGERGAALEDVAGALKLKPKDLRVALSAAFTQSERAEAEEGRGDESREETLAPEAGTERHQKAMALLRCPDVLLRAAEDMERLGHVGEQNAKQLAFACAVSARAGDPLQPSTHADSSAGKNFLWDTVLSFLPPEMVVRRSAISDKALFRTEADLRGAVLYLQEVAGSEGADFTIRVLQSAQHLEYEATEKTPDGSFRIVVHRKEGPVVVVQTTTTIRLYHENDTRVLGVHIDESENQTRLIVKRALADAATGGLSPEQRERILEPWKDAVRLLEAAEVVVPFAERMEIPTAQVRVRRDVGKILALIRINAWLHQHTRERDERGRIVATEDDFRKSKELIEESLRRAWNLLAPAEEKVLRAARELPDILKIGFKRKDLVIQDLSDSRTKEALKSLTASGYLECDGGRGPQGYTYALAKDAEKIDLGIRLHPPADEGESPANGPNRTGREAFGRYRPASEAEVQDERDGRSAGIGRDDDHPKETGDLQGKSDSGRSGADEEEDPPRDADWYEQMQKVFEGNQPEGFDPTCPAVADVLYRRTDVVEKGRYRPWN